MTQNLPTTTQPKPKSILLAVATRYQMEPEAFERTLRGTVFPGNGTREEFAAFLVVAERYKLDPITRQIYAFPKKGGGIVPVVGIDGWVHLVNQHPQMNGMEFEYETDEKGQPVSCTCRIFRKDRQMPTVVTEFLEECIRGTDPWKMKRRMLRHKALMQCARYAFGFSGIYDEDEAFDIANNADAPPPPPPPPPPPGAVAEHDAGTVEEAQIVEPEKPTDPAPVDPVGDAVRSEEPATFMYGEWMKHVTDSFATCMTEKDVDETHEGFTDTVEGYLTRNQAAEYAELHEAALTRVTDGAHVEGVAASSDQQEEAPAAPPPPAASKPAGAPGLDDDEDEQETPTAEFHRWVDEYLARGDLTKDLIADLVKASNPKRKALKAAGQFSDDDKKRMQTAMDTAWTRLDEAERASGQDDEGDGEDGLKGDEAQQDDPIAAFTKEFTEKMNAIQSMSELNAYFASTLSTRNSFGLEISDPRVKAWKQLKVDRTAAINGG